MAQQPSDSFVEDSFVADAPDAFTEEKSNPIMGAISKLTSPMIDISPTLRAAEDELTAKYPILKGLQFAQDVALGLTSPLDVTTAALSGGSSLATKAGMQGVSRAMGLGAKALSAPLVAEGGYNLANAESIPEAVTGGLEMAGGIAGLRGSIPSIKPKTSSPNPFNVPVRGQQMLPIEGIEQFMPKKQAVYIKMDADGSFTNTVSGEKFKDWDSVLRKAQQDPIGWREVINTPRAIMASMDFSAPLRQGLPLIHKKEWWNSFGSMFKSWGSQKFFDGLQQSIEMKPTYPLAKRGGLALTELTGPLSKKEEAFIGNRLVSWIPGLTRSNRAYVGFLNKLRSDTFDSLVQSIKNTGVDIENNDILLKQVAGFVNNATGRGGGELITKHIETLNAVAFSPRLIASRVQMLNPQNYLDPRINSQIRKEYWKSMAAMTATGNTILALARLGGADVNTDPTNSDFGKIKIGDTRIDVWGGFQQYFTLGTRMAPKFLRAVNDVSPFPPINFGARTSSGSGETVDLGEGAPWQNKERVALDFIQSKSNPIINFAWEWSKQNPNFDPMSQTAQMLVPMITKDLFELFQSDPMLAPLIIPAAFGVGVQTYDSR